MARNRKNQAANAGFGAVLKAAFLCFCIVVSCVGYLWQKKQIAELSQQIRNQEKQLLAQRANNVKLNKQLGELVSPPSLEARVRELKLGLGPAQPSQIWRLPEPPGEVAAALREAQYAQAGEESWAGNK